MLRHVMIALCLLLLPSPAAAQGVPRVVACADLPAVLAKAQGGERLELHGACPSLVIKQSFTPPLVIEAARVRVPGLTVTGGGIDWRAGTIVARDGINGESLGGYGALLRGARGVSFEGVTFTDAKQGLVIDGAADIAVRFSTFNALRADGIIASASSRLAIEHNRFSDFRPNPTRCTIGSAVVTKLAKRDCEARGGKWGDGDHPDAAQLRNGVIDAFIAFNVVGTTGQGITQMDTPGDKPLQRITAAANTIAAGRNGLTFGKCEGCVLRDNSLVTSVAGWKAVVIPGQALACGNTAPSGGAGREPCK